MLNSPGPSLSGFDLALLPSQGPSQHGPSVEDGEFGLAQLRAQLDEDNLMFSRFLPGLHLADASGSWKAQRHALERQRDFYQLANTWVEALQRHQTSGKDLETAGILTIHRSGDVAPKKGKSERGEAVDVPLRDYYSSKQVKWLQKELRRLVHTLPSVFHAQISLQTSFVRRLHASLRRRAMRKATIDATSPRDLFPEASHDSLLFLKWAHLRRFFDDDPLAARYSDAVMSLLEDLPHPDLLSLDPQPRHWEDVGRHYEHGLQNRGNLEQALAKNLEALAAAEEASALASSEFESASAQLAILQGDESASDESAQLAARTPQLESELRAAIQKVSDLKERCDKATQELAKSDQQQAANDELRAVASAFSAELEEALPLILSQQKPSTPEQSLPVVILSHLQAITLEALDQLSSATPLEDLSPPFEDDDSETFPTTSSDTSDLTPATYSSSKSSTTDQNPPTNDSPSRSQEAPPPSFLNFEAFLASAANSSSSSGPSPPTNPSQFFGYNAGPSAGGSSEVPTLFRRSAGLSTRPSLSGSSSSSQKTPASRQPAKPAVTLPEPPMARRRRFRASRSQLETPHAPAIAPHLIKLLNLVQLNLVHQTALLNKPRSPPTAQLVCYVNALVSSASLLLAKLRQVNATLSSSGSCSIDSRISAFVRRSYLDQVLRPLAAQLIVVLESASQAHHLAEHTVPCFMRLLQDLEAFSQHDQTATKLAASLRTPETFAVLEPVVLETPHNYSKNSEKEHVVTMPGVTHVCVAFDPRCATSPSDRLEIHTRVSGALQLAFHFSGPPSEWPRTPLVITGDSVTFRFFSDAFDTNWGFRAILTGLCVKTQHGELHDLCRTMASLVSASVSSLVAGPPLSRKELAFSRCLDYGLFSQPRSCCSASPSSASAALDPYLRDIIEHTPGSKAAADLDKLLSGRNVKIQRGNWRMSLESREAKGALRPILRKFVAVSILYEHLLDAAKSDSPSAAQLDSLSKLVYTPAARLSSTLVTLLNSIQNSSTSASSGIASSGIASSSSSSATPSDPSSSSSSSSSLPTDVELLTLLDARLALLLGQFDPPANLQDPSGEIFRFLTDSYALNDAAVFAKRNLRARLRALAFSTVSTLLRTAGSAGARQDALVAIGDAVMRIGRDAIGRTSHPLVSTGGAGAEQTVALSASFGALFEQVLEILKDGGAETNLRIAAFSIMAVNFSTSDLDLLERTQALSILHQLATAEDLVTSRCRRENTLYQAAWASFRFVVFRTLAGMSERDLTPVDATPLGLRPPSALHPLQHTGLELILSAIEQALPVLISRRHTMDQLLASAADEAEAAKEAYYREEDYIYRFLTTLLLSSHSQQTFDDLLRSERLGKVLVSLLDAGTFRLRRTALRALRRVLPVHTPSSAASFLPPSSQPREVVDFLLDLIGGILSVEDPELTNDPEPPQTLYFDAEVIFSFNCELVMLCRTLFSSANWVDAMRQAVNASLLRLPGLVDTSSETIHCRDRSSLFHVLAALAVVGGHTDKLRVGGRVEIRDSKELATVVSYDRYASSTRLLVDTSPTRISRPFDANRLLPLSEIEFDPSTLPLSTEVVSNFFLFNSTIHRRLPDISRPPSRGGLLTSSEGLPLHVDLAYHQVRSRTLQALARLLRCNQSAESLCAAGALSNLLQLAVLPTDLTSFKTLEQLEQQEERLWELLYQRRHTIIEPHTVQRLTQFERLPYSLFARSGARLPTGFDRESSSQVRFPAGHSDMRVVVGHIDPTRTLFAVGQARANFPIPLELKAFYFEVSIMPPASCSSAGAEISAADLSEATIAVGVCPRGHAFSSTPGDNKSYAYIGTTAQVAHGAGSLRGSTVGNFDYGEPFGPGDTIGVLITHRRELIFSKNGQSLGDAPLPPLDRSELYFPCVWVFQSGARVSINFGQESFKFPFESLLPSGYVRDLKSAAKPVEDDDVVELNPEEIQRQTKAQHLLALDLASDVRHCIIALERCNDDLNQAAEWLMAGGGQEILRMEEDAAMQRAIEESERYHNFGDRAPTPARPEEQRDDDEEVEDESLDAAGLEGADGTDAFENRNAARFLDDEIDSAIPVQVERRQRAADALSIEDLFVGMFLTVPLSHAGAAANGGILDAAGRTGVVKQVDVNAMRVELAFFDRETTSKFSDWFDFHSLQRPTDIWDDPCAEITPSQLKHTTIEVEHALCILKVRRSVFKLIQNWPAFPFALESLGGAEQLIDLLKLAASEFLQERQTGQPQRSLMGTLRERLALLLSDAGSDLPTILTNECITHFKRAVEVPPPKKTYRSPPGDRLNVDIKKRIHLPGANKLLVQFHHFDIDNGQLSRLAFFRDSQFQNNIASFRGNQCRPLVVDSDTVYLRYQTGLNNHTGYRFSVTPYEMRLNDRNALAGLNFSLGYWLLELLLDHGCSQVTQSYCAQLYTSLVHYVNHTKRGAKARGIQLLLRVLQEMNISPEAISMQEFEKLRVQMFRMYSLESKESPALNQSSGNHSGHSALHSAHLQSLIELMATARLSQLISDEKLHCPSPALLASAAAATPISSSAPSDDPKGKSFLRSSLGPVNPPSFSLRIIEASPVGEPEMNFSSLLQEYVDQRFGGSYLHIPADHLQCPIFRDLGISGALQISYAISDSDGVLLDQCERRINAGEALTLNPSSWFTDVVLTAFTAHSIVKRKQFPRQIASQAVRQLALRPASLPVTPFLPVESSSDGFGFSDVGYLGPLYSISFWLFISSQTTHSPASSGPDSSEEQGDRVRQVLFKGNPKQRQFDLTLNCRRKCFSLVFNTVNSPSARKLIELPATAVFDRWVSFGFSFSHDKLAVFTDGVSVLADKELAASPAIVSEPFFVGKIPAGLHVGNQDYPGFVGAVRDLRFFNRPLSPADIALLTPPSELPSSAHGKWVVEPLGPSFSDVDTAKFSQLAKDLEQWSHQMDSDLVRMCHELCERINQDPFHVPLEMLEFDAKSRATHPELGMFSAEQLRLRFAMIRLFNIRLANVFSLIDFSQSQIPWSLASSLFHIKGFIFTKTKMAMWNSILARTVARQGGSNHVRLNRHLTHRARERGDPECKRSVFGQLFQQLHFSAPDRLRITGQTWRVELVAEGGQDAGGVFRDSISHLCSDLQSSYLPLFVPVPNKSSMDQSQTSSGFENWHMWIPNTSSDTPYQLRMFAFVGKLMGIAIRAKHLLNLDIPPLIWKLLVGQVPLESDIGAVDTSFVNLIRNLKGQPPLGANRANASPPSLTEETFEDLELKWETTSWVPGHSVALVENGASIPVKWEERGLFADRAMRYRLEAFSLQVEAIRKGLSAIIPVALLPLFTWQELELQVCGKRELDIELLKRNTNYTYGVSKDDPHVALHWKMLEQFTPREHELFLRFVWGRGRLPIDDASFTQKYQIMAFSGGRGGKDENFLLPKSHTCFFQLELPRYRTLEQMCKMVRVAIENCISIDDDGQAAAADIEQALQIDD